MMLGVKRSRPSRACAASKKVKLESPVKAEVIKTEENSDDNSSDEETIDQNSAGNGGISDYERMRLENMRRNQEMLAQLNLAQAKSELRELIQPPKKKPVLGLKREPKPKEVLPMRQSLRIRNMDPEGVALPEKPPVELASYEPQHRWEYKKRVQTVGLTNLKMYTKGNVNFNNIPRKPEGPLEMTTKNQVDDKDLLDLIKGLNHAATKCIKPTKIKAEFQSDMDRYEESMNKLHISENHVAKVVPDRIFSLAVHPTLEKTLVYAGDKWGKLGLWDVGSDGGNNGVYLFEPHSRPINCLRFSPTNSCKLFSTSYDGTVRCMDVEKSVFDEVYATDEDDDLLISSLAFLSSDASSMVLGLSDGNVLIVDSRAKDSSSLYQVHDKMVRSVDVSTGNPNLLVTGSTDRGIGLWDLRYMSKRSKAIEKASRFRVVNSAFFSPNQGKEILTTSADNTICLYEGETLKKISEYSHNNNTGRWLTKFRAEWDPKTENCFVVGNMGRPRQVDIYCTEKKRTALTHLIHESMSSITSLNTFHPSRNILAGGNSSGKVFLWTEQ